MFESIRDAAHERFERLRREGGTRAIALGIAVALEVLLLLLLFSLGYSDEPKFAGVPQVTTVDVSNEEDAPETPEPEPEAAADNAQPTFVPPAPPSDAAPALPVPIPPPAVVLPVERPAPPPAVSPPAPAPAAPPRPGVVLRDAPSGPPNRGGSSGDTQRVGTAPNGEPLYAAAWYREPYDDELRGYLSTANGPGWGLIACRTVPDYRVEDCVGLDEYPSGSNMLRAVLAAAWQFRVRPPRRGGKSMVGAWVRLRITYEANQTR